MLATVRLGNGIGLDKANNGNDEGLDEKLTKHLKVPELRYFGERETTFHLVLRGSDSSEGGLMKAKGHATYENDDALLIESEEPDNECRENDNDKLDGKVTNKRLNLLYLLTQICILSVPFSHT